jgi:acetyl esterase/lipase
VPFGPLPGFETLPVATLLILLALAPLATAADYQIQANIRYAPYAETVLDIVQSPAPALKNRPVVIVIHGGGWVEGDKESMLQRFCLPFVQHDYVVANVEYRLAKSASAPAAVIDVRQAAQWLHKHAADFKVDANQIVAMGDSAGGHLALMAGLAPASAELGPAIQLAGVIEFYGVADLADQPYAAAWIPDQPDRLDLARRLSPITYVRKGLPPVLAIHGDADTVVPYDQSVRLTKALKAAGSDAELITVPGGRHGFEPAEMDKLWPQIFKWLKKRKIS